MVDKIDTPDRPASVALVSALEDSISMIAVENLTPIEVLGCLDLVARDFYQSTFCDN